MKWIIPSFPTFSTSKSFLFMKNLPSWAFCLTLRDWRFTAVLRSSVESPDLLGVRGELPQITVLHGEKKYVLKETPAGEVGEDL